MKRDGMPVPERVTQAEFGKLADAMQRAVWRPLLKKEEKKAKEKK